ncbi:MAG TPA: lipopolysaccharide heptosyltransferase family protein [Flammeovirgaceae bacterium]|nr:lipopolysaccharide heptosyltransferase family protein [Flammeovirgaceae bacterium]
MQVLAIRLSSMGDVALTVPVLRGVLAANPGLQITLVSAAHLEPFFFGIERLNFYGVRLELYPGLSGLRQLYKKLQAAGPWDAVLDLHSVLRTWALDGFFRLAGVPVYRIDKGRKEKRALVRPRNRQLKPLRHTTQRYLEVFEAAGLPGAVAGGEVIKANPRAMASLERFLEKNGLRKEGRWIGIAPFALHREKTWPLSKITTLIEALSKEENCRIFLLGGKTDAPRLQHIAALYESCHNMAGVFSLDEEIALVHMLDAVVAMDSFNMHLAALCNRKVVSVWGATHPYAGFGPLNGNERFIVQVPPGELSCRPCSIFGDKPCSRGDLACLEKIDPVEVLHKL